MTRSDLALGEEKHISLQSTYTRKLLDLLSYPTVSTNFIEYIIQEKKQSDKRKSAIKRTFIEKLKLTITAVKHEVSSKP